MLKIHRNQNTLIFYVYHWNFCSTIQNDHHERSNKYYAVAHTTTTKMNDEDRSDGVTKRARENDIGN